MWITWICTWYLIYWVDNMDLKLPSDILLVVAKKSTNSGFIGKKFSTPTSMDNVYLPVSLNPKDVPFGEWIKGSLYCLDALNNSIPLFLTMRSQSTWRVLSLLSLSKKLILKKISSSFFTTSGLYYSSTSNLPSEVWPLTPWIFALLIE